MSAADGDLLPLAATPRKARLLVVDDQPIHLQVLYRALSGDHQLFMATSGAQALKVVREQTPDLVLLDVVMPDMDGFEVLQQLKSNPETAAIPVIFVTAHGGDEIETQCLHAGAVDFIPKPVNPSVVRARVKTHLTLKFQSDFLRDMAFLDGLTGVSNRRQFDERLPVEWGRAQRHGSALTLIMLDVDSFKAYNDHYGHQQGDACLRRVGEALRLNVRRAGELVARYGGEEFVVVMPGATVEQALQMAEAVRVAVWDARIAHVASPVAPELTVSLGVAVGTPRATDLPDHLIQVADAALYEAKRQGRNRTVLAAAPIATDQG